METFTERFKDLEVTRIVVFTESGELEVQGTMLDGQKAWILVRLAPNMEIEVFEGVTGFEGVTS